MKALVTGGTGFIGSRVVQELLTGGHSVRLHSRKSTIPRTFQGEVEIVRGDLEDPHSVVRAMEGMNLLFHIGEIKNTSKASSEKNVKLIESVVPAMQREGLGRLVFVSSLSVSGIPSTIPADEETPASLVLHDHYTAYKRKVEEIITSAPPDFEYSIVRPAPVYGPGSRYLGRLVSVIEKIGPLGIPFPGGGENMAPLIHVADLARAIVLAGTRPEAAGKVFILSDGFRHSWHEFFTAIAGSMGKDIRIIPLPLLLLKLAAVPLDLFSMFLGVDLDPVSYLNYFSKDLLFDSGKAKKLLGWEPRYALDEGVKEMVRSYKKK